MDEKFNSASNKYQFCILLVDLSPWKTRNTWKTWCWHQHHVCSCLSCFSWSEVYQKYAKWVLIGSRFQLCIQRVLPFEIWVKPHGDKLKTRVEKVVFKFFFFKIWWGKLILFYYFHYYFIISLRRPILDLKIYLMTISMKNKTTTSLALVVFLHGMKCAIFEN